MKFLLINTNAAVKKIFSIAARKAAIQLDTIGSISNISLQEDYNCIFIDDGVLDTGNFQNFKNKMITTKFCLILSKDKAVVSGFDSYIRKPFLPTDIYDVLKKEKYNEINFSSYDNDDINNQQEIIQENINIDDELPATDVSDININSINQSINNIDLSEFQDTDDEFLSGIKDNTPISLDDMDLDLENADEIKTTNQNTSDDINLNNFNTNDNMADTINDNDEISFTYDDESKNDIDNISIKDTDDTIPLDTTFDLVEQEVSESPIESQDTQDMDSVQNSYNINNNADSNDNEIDFSSIFALQDEFLQSQKLSQPKGLVGGDIYTKKEPAKTTQNKQTQSNQNQTAQTHTINPAQTQIAQQPQEAPKNTQTQVESTQVQNTQSFSDFKELENMDFDEIKTTQSQDADILDFDIQDNSFDDFDDNQEILINQNNININDLSDEELDNLDDDTLLKLQEESLNNDNEFSQDFDDFNQKEIEPQILDKNDINELTEILEETNPIQNNLKIQNNELSSLTQEALSEVLDETNNSDKIDDDFSFDNLNDDFIQDPQMEQSQPTQNLNTIQNNPTNTHINIGDSSNNLNVDLSEIIKSLPIDKLRELLSGVQITINITFPNKKQ